MRELKAGLETDGSQSPDLRTCRSPMRELLGSGDILAFQAGNRTEYTTPASEISLAEILERAAGCVSKKVKGRPGSTALDASRAVEAINEKLWARIRTLCHHLARHVREPGDADLTAGLARIRGEVFEWDPDAGRGHQGDWRAFLALVEAATPPNGRSQAIGTGRKLLDLAATHEWITKAPRHERSYEAIPPEWAAVFNRWRAGIAGRVDHPKSGLFALLQACQALEIEPLAAGKDDWVRVIAHLEDRFRGPGWPPAHRTRVRRVYRALVHSQTIGGPAWRAGPAGRENPLTLCTGSQNRGVARLFGSDGDQPGVQDALAGRLVPWKGLEHFESGLVGNEFGLRRWLLYQTAPAMHIRRLRLPPRGVFPRSGPRNFGPGSGKPWRTGTIEGALERVLRYARWLAAERSVDWSRSDLRTLLNWDHLMAFETAVLDQKVIAVGQYARLVEILGRMASPYLEAVAVQRGDTGLADEMADFSRRLLDMTPADGELSIAFRLKRQMGARQPFAEMRQKAGKIEDSWTENQTAARIAFEQLRRVGRLHLERIEAKWGCLADQNPPERPDSVAAREWARSVRDVLYWFDQMHVPLRVRSSQMMDRADRRESGAHYRQIWLELPRSKLKTGSGRGFFKANYARAESKAESYPRDLYRLYVMEGGARDILRRGKTLKAFYVPDQARGGTGRRLTPSGFRTIVRRLVQEVEADLGVRMADLQRAGALGTHFFRHAFATAWVRLGKAHEASILLQHANMNMVMEVYSGVEAHHLDPSIVHRDSA